MTGINNSRVPGIVRLLLLLHFVSHLVSLVSCVPQQQTSTSSSSSGSGDNGDNEDNEDKRIARIERKYPIDLSYRDVVIQYELDDESEIDPGQDGRLQLQNAWSWDNEIDYEKQTLKTELGVEQDINNHYYISLIKFAQPVKFKSARIIYALESVSCTFHVDVGEEVLATIRPGSGATLDSSSEEVGFISCRTEKQEIYSDL